MNLLEDLKRRTPPPLLSPIFQVASAAPAVLDRWLAGLIDAMITGAGKADAYRSTAPREAIRRWQFVLKIANSGDLEKAVERLRWEGVGAELAARVERILTLGLTAPSTLQ